MKTQSLRENIHMFFPMIFLKLLRIQSIFLLKKKKIWIYSFNDYHFANVIDIKTFVLPTLLYHNIQYKNTHRKLFTTQKSNALQNIMSVQT